MNRALQVLLIGVVAWGLATPLAAEDVDRRGLLVLSYHDVRDDVAWKGDPDRYAVSTQNFAAHLDWLAGHGYHPVSLSAIIAAARGEGTLPDQPVLLTFDDGLRSAYTHVFPLLRAYDFPALVAVVTDWVDLASGRKVDYGPRDFTHEDFLTWDQLREMQASGLIEVASHSHDMHRGVRANPQGNLTAAAITRTYDPATRRHETEEAYTHRVRADLTESRDRIARELGVAPRAVVWPFAAYNSVTNKLAEELGLGVTFDLEGREHQLVRGAGLEALHGLSRLLVFENMEVKDLAFELRRDKDVVGTRALQIDLDYVYDSDPGQQQRNLDRLIERVKQIGPSHVYLQAFADPDGNGSAAALYFPNRHMPVRADLFSHVTWQLRTRANVKVFAWLPVLGYELPDVARRQSLALTGETPEDVFRLDPGNPETLRVVGDIYEDLAVNAYFEGLLFHDDAYLRRSEAGDLPDVPALRTRALVDFTHELTRRAERWRPKLVTVRNLYPRTVLEPASEAWFGQHLADFLEAYDFTAVMAMPWLEGSPQPDAWMDQLLAAVRRQPRGLERTVFTLQTRDWNTGKSIPPDHLKAQVRRLLAGGGRHFAWYPDDFIADDPPLAAATEAMSARTFPYRER